MTSSTIVQKLWNYCNILRDDGLGYGDYAEQLTYLLFLKMPAMRMAMPLNRRFVFWLKRGHAVISNRQYISDELFHLLGFRHPNDHEKNYDILKKILSDGWVSYAPHSKDWGETRIIVNWDADLISGEFIVPTVTCFADIPFECLALHAGKYGRFGFAIDRRILVYHHARPVIYIPYLPEDRKSISGLGLITHIRNVFKGFERLVAKDLTDIPIYHGAEPKTPDEAVYATSNVFLKEFLAFVKPFDSTLEDNDLENYYMEREWRKFGNLELRHDYVRKIIVGADYVDRIKKDFPEYQDKVCECPT